MAEPNDVPLIARRLRAAFGTPRRRPVADPVEELISTVLSQHTTAPNSDRALEALRARFPSWEAIADADPAEIATCIRSAGLANQKAPRIKSILRHIETRRGAMNLDFLRALSVDEAMQWLVALPGVGQTTAACLLLFGLRLPAMPIDTGIARVAARLGVVRAGSPADRTQRVLEDALAPARIYGLHVNLIQLAREVCRPRDPLCGICPLNDLCDAFAAPGRAVPPTVARAAVPGSRP